MVEADRPPAASIQIPFEADVQFGCSLVDRYESYRDATQACGYLLCLNEF